MTDAKTHILTVSVEEYFHAGALAGAVRPKHWDRFEPRLARTIDLLLASLARHGHTATFFVLGCIADDHPDLVRTIVDAGHEVACGGYWPRSVAAQTPAEFRADLRRAKRAIEDASGCEVRGFRAPRHWLAPDDLWCLDVLVEEGFAYDSSINPSLATFAGKPQFTVIREHARAGGSIWELPITTVGIGGLRLAATGGNYARQLPHRVMRRIVAHLDRTHDAPLVFYLMSWELDTLQPHVTALPRLGRMRMYRNLGKTKWVFEDYFSTYRFRAIADHLCLARVPVLERPRLDRPVALPEASLPVPSGVPVSLVVPLYNEEPNVAYLHRALAHFRAHLARTHRVHVVLVDDGSQDGTWPALQAHFGSDGDTLLIRQPVNGGVAAAIRAGIDRAPTDVVCSIDCDLSYDPTTLAEMIPLIGDADIVTASPYHPAGRVMHVPAWRLFLSKTLSRLYSRVLGDRIHTYTSCCRVYRRSTMQRVDVVHGGFLGVAEMLIRARLGGARVVEHPATLESRLFGESKMKVARTIRGHLGLLWELLWKHKSSGRQRVASQPTAAR
ncbi:MAG: glycosyltransferase [Vicinamibacterales bacterium]